MCRLGRQPSQEEQERAFDGRVIYRIKEEIRDWDDQPVFPKRDVKDPSYADIPREYNELLKNIAMFFDWLQENEEERAYGFVKSQALQIAASSPKAGFAFLLRRYLRYFDDDTPEQKLLNWVELLIPYRHWSKNQKPKKLLEELRKLVSRNDEEDYENDDSGSAVGPAAVKVRNKEKTHLSRLLSEYSSLLSKPSVDAKFELLVEQLQSADEPFVVFAQYLDTVYEIKRQVEKSEIPCYLIVGGQDPHERRRVIEKFTNQDTLGRRVLVSSSAGGEGINLQCSRRLIHFDLPWNPMVLEQRIGRVHRIGTVDTVIVDTILLKGSREADIYQRLQERLTEIVKDLTEDERKQAQYFRRIMAGIPLETLRDLFGGNTDDQIVEIGRAVETGQQRVQQVDEELQQHKVTTWDGDKGRANMEHLVELLSKTKKIERMNDRRIKYQRVVFDSDKESFKGVNHYTDKFLIKDGTSRKENKWVIFDREAATRASSVKRDQSGGIDHPMVSLALQSIRTPKDIESMSSLAIGIGVFDQSYLNIFSAGATEPVIILSYVSARLVGDYYFDHEIHLFVVSESNQMVEKLGQEDGELVEEIIWNNVRRQGKKLVCPKLSSELIERLVEEDIRIRHEMMDNVRDENGRWIGAVWPIAATVLVPE